MGQRKGIVDPERVFKLHIAGASLLGACMRDPACHAGNAPSDVMRVALLHKTPQSFSPGEFAEPGLHSALLQ